MQNSNILWIDIETSGLDISCNEILEVAIIITNKDLGEISKPFNFVVHHDGITNMSSWCLEQHTRTGLLAECIQSSNTITDVEDEIIKAISEYFPYGKIILAGSSVSFDKEFIKVYMPKFFNHLHYRIIDVSSFREIVNRWYPNDKFEKVNNHRASSDIQNSLDLLKHYRENFFVDIQ